MRITGFLILGLLIFANIAVKSRLPPVKKPFTLREYFVPFLELPFLLLAIGSFFVYVGAFLPFNFIIVEARNAGTPLNITEYLVPIVNAASIFGRIFPAHLGDVYGVFNVCIVFTIFSGAISLAIWLPAASPAPLIVFAVLYGFASGLTLAIIPALVASISDIQKLGHRVGTLYAFSAFGSLFGSPIAGAIVGAQDGAYTGLKIFCGVTLITVSRSDANIPVREANHVGYLGRSIHRCLENQIGRPWTAGQEVGEIFRFMYYRNS